MEVDSPALDVTARPVTLQRPCSESDELELCRAGNDEAEQPTDKSRKSARRNAWGCMSYAELITQAILSSPEKRRTLNQIYEWMVENIPYFKDKGDSNSSAGWKVSVLDHFYFVALRSFC